MKTIENLDSVFVEHEGTRYMIELPGWKQLDKLSRRRVMWGIEEYIRIDGDKSVEIVQGTLKIIRLGPV